MKNSKTTVLGALLAGTTAVTAVVNYQELSTKQLCLLFGFAVAQFLLGLWAHDPPR